MKNIGFLEACKERPDGLFIFHDVDTYPVSWNSIQYEAKKGQFRRPVKNTADDNLGLICSCWKDEFEKTNGFPNYYGWGSEDSALYFRAKTFNITIDESNICMYNDKRFIINHNHYRNDKKEHYYAYENGKLLNEEKNTSNFSNGLSSIEYEVLSSFEISPKFTIYNVTFKLKNE